MVTLIISDKEQFGNDVFQMNDVKYWKNENFESWKFSAKESLKRVYDSIDNGGEVKTSDLYVLGDVINLLDVMQINASVGTPIDGFWHDIEKEQPKERQLVLVRPRCFTPEGDLMDCLPTVAQYRDGEFFRGEEQQFYVQYWSHYPGSLSENYK